MVVVAAIGVRLLSGQDGALPWHALLQCIFACLHCIANIAIA
jgi:hypothetical protein